jgi:hypothetical protein
VTLVSCPCDAAELNKRSQQQKPMKMQPHNLRLHDIFHLKQHGVIEQVIISVFFNDMIL